MQKHSNLLKTAGVCTEKYSIHRDESFSKLANQHIAMDTPSETAQALAAIRRNKRTFNSLQHKSYIKFKKCCSITGCSVLSSDKIVLADNHNSTLLIVNTEKNVVVEEKQLDSKPWDIAVLPQNQIAVTMPYKQQILIVTTADKLSTDHTMNVKGNCRGIIFHKDCLYVLCQDPRSIHVLGMKGNIKSRISLEDQSVNHCPWHIEMNQDYSLLYVSNIGNNSIVSVTTQGEVSAVYKHKDIVTPTGMLLMDDGSVLVCCQGNHTIHHVSADLKQSKKVLDGLNYPWVVCYSSDRSEVYIGGNDVKLSVYIVINKIK